VKLAKEFPLDIARLLGVLNYLNDAVYITDRGRKILLWNKRAEEITGYSAGEVVGSRCMDNILVHIDKYGHPLCTTNLCPLYRAIIKESPSKTPVLIYAKHKKGHRIPVSVSVAPMRDDAGEVIGGIEIFRDETANLRDLEFARRVQKHALPQELPQLEKISFDVRYFPHELIGGDFYWLKKLSPSRVALLIADVRGHGVSASLYTMILRSLVGMFENEATQPAKFTQILNQKLADFTVEESFATAFYAIADQNSMSLSYCGAGHPPLLLMNLARGEITRLEGTGLPLGVEAAETYSPATIPLAPPSLLLFYTDGAIEVFDKDENPFGVQGLENALLGLDFSRSQNPLDELYEKLLGFSGEVELPDDVLFISLQTS
jgi:PAS domain S-box-containing protein